MTLLKPSQKEADKIWNEILKDDFTNYVDNIFNDSMKKFESQMKDFLQSIKAEKNPEQSQANKENENSSHANPLSFPKNTINNEAPKQNTHEPSALRRKFIPQTASDNANNSMNNANNSMNNTNNSIKGEDTQRNKIINANNQGFHFKNLGLPMNSNALIKLVLHCLSNMKPLLNLYLNQRTGMQQPFQNLPIYQNNLSTHFHKLIENYWNNNNIYSLNDIDQIMKSLMNNNYYTTDPGLIFQTFLNRINFEEGSNSLKMNNNYIFNNCYNYSTIMQYQNHFYKTKIENCLYNIILTKKECKNCKQEQLFFQHLPIINLFVKDNKFNNTLKTDLISLAKMNDNGNFEPCPICRNMLISSNTNNIYNTSKVIIFNLNRDYDRNNMIMVEFPFGFAKNKLVNQNVLNCNYELIAYIQKKSYNNFILNMKASNGQWYCYDNDTIRQENYFDTRFVYTLIYQIIEN